MIPALLIATLVLPPTVQDTFVPFDAGESSRLDWWTKNLRWDLDASQRVGVNGDGDLGTLGAFGLDTHNVLSADSRDLATLVLQPYLLRLDDTIPAPGLFDDDHDFAVQWRIFNVNAHVRADRALSVRAGHFELPFGLEQNIDTNGTLKQYTHGANFGLKTDWGVTANGELDGLEYELAWSRGSGNEYLDRGGDGVVSGRVGTPRSLNRVLGLSFATGDFLSPQGIVDRRRVALDAQYFAGPVTASIEVGVGEDDGTTDIARGVAELEWHNRFETQSVWLQLFATDRDSATGSDEGTDVRLGGRWALNQGLSVGAQFVQTLDPLESGASRSSSLVFQLRYRL